MTASRKLLAALVAVAACAACGGDDRGFDLARARGHVDHLAGRIGSRAIDTPANVAARQYLVDQLRQIGFDVRIQAADVRRGHINARVYNIIGTRAGEVPDAIALISHYDSQPQAAGALDDGWAVAASVEAAHALAGRTRHSLFVIVTDGEESGLLGARAAVDDDEVRNRVRAFLNFDGTGAAGPVVLFETTRGGGPALAAWARSAPEARGGSFAIEIYKRLPNDTDFTIFSQLNASGLNFAPVRDSYAYHTDRDVAARVSDETISHAGRTAVAVVRELDGMDLSAGRGNRELTTYFSLAGRGVAYGAVMQRTIAVVAVAGGLVVWIWLIVRLIRTNGGRATSAAFLWGVGTALAAVAGMVVMQALLRAIRPEVSPWYARPGWWWIAMIGAAAASMWLVSRWSRAVKTAPIRTPAGVWAVVLPAWIVLAALAERVVPAAAFLMTIPLAAAAILIAVSLMLSRSLRLPSALVFILAALLWWPDTHLLLSFIVPLFGWMPAPLPAAAFPALLSLAALMTVPPIRAVWAGRLERAAMSPAVGGTLGILALFIAAPAIWSPAYTPDRPVRRSLRYVHDAAGQRAWWDIGGREPGTDTTSQPPESLVWRTDNNDLVNRRVPALGLPYTYRADVAPMTTVPASVEIEPITSPEGQTVVRVRIAPSRPISAVTIQVPSTNAPIASSLGGRVSGSWWSAIYLGVPDSGLDLELTFERPAADLLGRIGVLLHTTDVPSAGAGRVPAWLSSERATWTTQSVFVVTPRAAGQQD